MISSINRVHELAAERNLSIHAFAAHCHVPYSTLKNAESRGSQLKLETITQICLALDITYHDFFPVSEPRRETAK